MAFVTATAGHRFSLKAGARTPIGRLPRIQALLPRYSLSENSSHAWSGAAARSAASQSHAAHTRPGY